MNSSYALMFGYPHWRNHSHLCQVVAGEETDTDARDRMWCELSHRWLHAEPLREAVHQKWIVSKVNCPWDRILLQIYNDFPFMHLHESPNIISKLVIPKWKKTVSAWGAFQLMFQLLNCGISCRIAWISIFICNHSYHLHTVGGPPSHGEPVVRHQRFRCRWAAEHVMEGDVCRNHFKIGFSWFFHGFSKNQRLHTLWKAILPIAVKKSKESWDNWSIL